MPRNSMEERSEAPPGLSFGQLREDDSGSIHEGGWTPLSRKDAASSRPSREAADSGRAHSSAHPTSRMSDEQWDSPAGPPGRRESHTSPHDHGTVGGAHQVGRQVSVPTQLGRLFGPLPPNAPRLFGPLPQSSPRPDAAVASGSDQGNQYLPRFSARSNRSEVSAPFSGRGQERGPAVPPLLLYVTGYVRLQRRHGAH